MERQKECQIHMQKMIECQKGCQKICQKNQKECQKIRKKECQKICQRDCQICQKECQHVFHYIGDHSKRTFFTTCQVRVVRFHVSCLGVLSSLLLVVPFNREDRNRKCIRSVPLPDINHQLRTAVSPARTSTASVPRSSGQQCPALDLNRQLRMAVFLAGPQPPVFPDGPQPPPRDSSVPRQTSTPERMSEDMPERTSEDMPDIMSERMSKNMPERVSGDTPERMSEDMPERMSAAMPDRMPA